MSYQPPQQPFTQYPPPLPQSPPQKPSFWKRKVGCLPVWGLILIAVLVCYAVGSAAFYHPTTTISRVSTALTPPAITVTALPTDTPLPTVAPAKWATTHTFTGNGSKKTGTFSSPDDWKIVWKCNPASFSIAYNVIITVYNSDGSYADSGVNTTCSKSNTHDETEEHQSGSVYLDIVSEGSWSISVQELK